MASVSALEDYEDGVLTRDKFLALLNTSYAVI